MTYKQWLDWYNKEPFDYPPNARDGWFACKHQIIKLLEKNKSVIMDEDYELIKELIKKEL